MTSSNSVDELFLKASSLEGRQRQAFLRTLPPDSRAKVSALLAADKSVANREFLGDVFHDNGTNKRQNQRRLLKDTSNSINASRQSKVDSRLASRRRSKKTDSTVSGKRAQSRISSRSQKSRRVGNSAAAAKAHWFLAIGGVLVCSLLVWLIATSLTGPEPEDPEFAKTRPSLVKEILMDDQKVASVDQGAPGPSKPLTDLSRSFEDEERPFFTAAVSAPPLSPQELGLLPKAMSPISLVTSPTQLPSVRSWTIETVGHRAWSHSVALSEDGRLAAFASSDGNIRIVDCATGRLQSIIVMLEGSTCCLQWSKTNEFLFACGTLPNGSGAKIERLQISTGRAINTFDATAARVDLAFDASGPPFVITDDKSQLYLINGKQIVVLSALDLSVVESVPLGKPCTGLALSPDRKFLLTSGAKAVTMFKNDRPLKEIATVEREALVTKHSWSSHGLVATGWRDGKVIVYDANADGVPIVAEVQAFPLNDFYIRAICHEWVNDDIVLVTGTGSSVKHISVSKNSVVQQFENSRWHPPLCYSQKLKAGIIAGAEGRRLVRGEPKQFILEGDVSLMECVAFSADGRFVAVSGFNQAVYDLVTGFRGPVATKPKSLSYQQIQFADSNRMACSVDSKVDTYSQCGPEGKVLNSFDLKPKRPADAIFIQSESNLLVRCRDGSVMHCRQGVDDGQQLLVPSNDPIRGVVWNRLRNVAVLVSKSHIYEWDPFEDVVRLAASTPTGCSAAVVANSAGTHLALSGDRVAILEATTYSEIANHDWKRTDVRWSHEGDLIGFAKRGEILHSISLDRPDEVNSTFIPLKDYSKPFGLSVSPIAPVAVAILPGHQMRFIDTRNGRHLGTIVPFGPKNYGTVSPEGRIISASNGFLQKIVY